MENVLKGKRSAEVVEVKQKLAAAPKGIEVNEFKHRGGPWASSVIGVLPKTQSPLKVTEV